MRDLIGRVEFFEAQHQRWIEGELSAQWAKRYPQLFDQDDLSLARSQGPSGYHFYEWLGAIILHHSTGYLSLVEKYEFKKHKRKRILFEQLASAELLFLVDDRETFGNSQCPDLLMYSTDRSDWFFCEVKGHGDRTTATQREYFAALEKVTGKPIRELRFQRAG